MSLNEQLYYNGDIYTVDDYCPTAEALAVKDGLIVAVGSENSCRTALSSAYEPVDLRGGTLLPGFIDTHIHPSLMVYYDMNLNLSGVSSIPELQEKIRQEAAKEPQNLWLVGLQFDDHAVGEGAYIGHRVLDAACPHRPVIVVTYDGHRVVANTKAIEEAGLSPRTPDPAGGKIEREPGGFPLGVFHETAAQLLLSKVPLPDFDTIREAAALSFAKLASYGITSAGVILQTGEEGPAGSNGAFDVPFMQMVLDRLPVNTYGMLITGNVEDVEAARQTELHQVQEGSRRRIGAVKMFCDGTLQAATAYMAAPYIDQPGNRGFMVLKEEELYKRMKAAHKAGLQIAIHAIGDAANGTCVELYKRLLEEFPRENHRHRLEHASVLDAELIADIAALKLVVSSQPLFIHGEKHWLPWRLGPERTRWVYPYRSIVEAGIKFAGASDAPICAPDVLHALQCCVTREGFEEQQALTPAQAVRAYTIDAAYAQFEEQVKGSLSPGKRADLVILSANPVKVPPGQIHSIKVLATICGGQVAFQA